LVFDIEMLAGRLGPAVDWLRRSPWGDLPVGLFGASTRLRCPSQLAVFRGATDLYEEPAALRAAAETARDWFATHLRHAGQRGRG
jgi:hypothetical protein